MTPSTFRLVSYKRHFSVILSATRHETSLDKNKADWRSAQPGTV